MRDCFRADGFAGTGRAGKVEGQAEPGSVPLREPPVIEDQVVLADLRERIVERPHRALRQDHVVKGTARRHRGHQVAPGPHTTEKQVSKRVRHVAKVPRKGTAESQIYLLPESGATLKRLAEGKPGGMMISAFS